MQKKKVETILSRAGGVESLNVEKNTSPIVDRYGFQAAAITSTKIVYFGFASESILHTLANIVNPQSILHHGACVAEIF